MKEAGGKFRNMWIVRGLLLAAVLCVCAAFMPVKAMASLKVKNIEWEGKGRVELHFRSRVEYGKLRVKVRDAEGNKHTALIRERKSDELEFQVDGLTQGAKYYYTVSGVRRKGSGKRVTVKGSFTVPVTVNGITVKETDVDLNKRRISFEFLEKVEWSGASVSISDGKREYVKKIMETDDDNIKVSVRKMKSGKKYTWTISGIRAKGQTEYVTMTGTLRAS